MIASDWVVGSVVVGDQGALVGCADLPVPPDPGGQGKQPLRDPDPHPLRRPAAVLFQSKLALEGVEGALDPLADTPQGPMPAWLVGPVGAQQPRTIAGDELFEVAAGEALVADQQQPRTQAATLVIEQGGDHLALAQLGLADTMRPAGRQGRQAPTGESPRSSVVALAVAIAGVAGQLRALDGLPRRRTRQRGGVDQPQLVAPAWRMGGDVLDGQADQGGGAAQPPVVGRWGRQVGKQVAQPLVGEPQPAPLGAEPEQDLGDGQTDQLSIGEFGSPSGPATRAEQLIDGDIQCDDEGVEVGVHEASKVDVADATPTLGTLANVVTARHPQPDSEANI